MVRSIFRSERFACRRAPIIVIRFDRFSWQFAQASFSAVEDISLHLQRGEFVTVAGPSGSGKTTLAMAMCGLLVGRQAGDATGNVFVDGLNVAEIPLFRIAERIGLVQQNPEAHFATLTVEDEIAFGMENHCAAPEEIRRRSREAMELLGISHLGDRDLGTLSGGEQQRVAVASIVAGEPSALVLDEPTASLDPEASRHLFRVLSNLCRRTGLTVVIIEHKLAHLLPLKPRLLYMDKGRIVADIPSDQLEQTYSGSVVTRTAARDRFDARCATPTEASPVIDASHVTVEVGGETILRDVNLHVKSEEVLGVLGPNGGGKTTLLHCLLGLVQPVRGSIQLFGASVSAAKTSQLARHVGLVFQNADHQLVTDTVQNEALFAARTFKCLDQTIQQRGVRLLTAAGLDDRTDDHPFRLSWGQKRRLNVISAVLHRPRLLLLDEPFAGQDWDNAAFLLDVLTSVVRGHPIEMSGGEAALETDSRTNDLGACLVVTHDPRVILQSCTRVLFICEGQLLLDAPVPEAFDRLRAMGHEAYTVVETGYTASVDAKQGEAASVANRR